MSKVEGGMKCVKYLLFVFNFIFWVSRYFYAVGAVSLRPFIAAIFFLHLHLLQYYICSCLDDRKRSRLHDPRRRFVVLSCLHSLTRKFCTSFAFTYNFKYMFTVQLPQPEVLFISRVQSTGYCDSQLWLPRVSPA